MQVIMTFFELMIDFEYFWKDTSESWPSSIFGFGLGAMETPPPVSVDTEALYSSFIKGFDWYGEVPFYHSRILSFVNKTIHMDIKECEEYFEKIVRVFEQEKPYLIQRWNEEQRKLGNKFFRF
jgi:hypothetical protein